MKKSAILFLSLLLCCMHIVAAQGENNVALYIPYGTTEIDYNLITLLSPSQITSVVYIPDTVTSIDFSVFHREIFSNVESFYVSSQNSCYKSVDGAILSKDGKQYCMYPRGRAATSYAIPQGVETIGEYAFFEADMEVVIFPDSLVEISNCAFSYSEIVHARFNNGLSAIGDFAFMGCNRLEGVSFPSTLKQIGCEAFSECSIDCVDIPEGVLEIGGGAFAFNHVSVMILPSTLEFIGNSIIGWNHMEDEDYFTTVIVTSETLGDYYASEYLSAYHIVRIDK